ncbi:MULTISPECIES: TetR/AcrR family transcriptional regulator [Streptomyces]|uniref:TetR/AcrR family transcriptional regulator n=2 Tax=Streptomyces TaxID=1883 RepID=A0ABD5EGH8_9ACTN|nr:MULTISPECIES: TetR/AcrR family transcriptional regulator [unclassified Streptomyces]MDT0433736.1 TetR/AcrR family transcriptional regulator [Streptomyces sp. DSM 41981]MYQ62702.1 TetR family transcriptional regulator [Streptomyces sp. SID4950]SCD42794.1 transcriptional regulator, TetR family [Streptomyces sp. SolWspMP-5a-2]
MTRPAPEDPRAARTRARLRAALFEECAEHPLGEVGVASLVRRAGVGRATFYVHYDGLEALAVDACADVVREGVDALHSWTGRPDPVHAPLALVEFFTSLAPHADLYRALLTPGGGGPLGKLLHHDLRAYSLRERERAGAADAPLVATAVAATFAGVLADWLHGLLPGSPREISDQVWQLLVALHASR